MSIRKAKKPAIISEWRENKIAQEKAQQEAGLVARQLRLSVHLPAFF